MNFISLDLGVASASLRCAAVALSAVSFTASLRGVAKGCRCHRSRGFALYRMLWVVCYARRLFCSLRSGSGLLRCAP